MGTLLDANWDATQGHGKLPLNAHNQVRLMLIERINMLDGRSSMPTPPPVCSPGDILISNNWYVDFAQAFNNLFAITNNVYYVDPSNVIGNTEAYQAPPWSRAGLLTQLGESEALAPPLGLASKWLFQQIKMMRLLKSIHIFHGFHDPGDNAFYWTDQQIKVSGLQTTASAAISAFNSATWYDNHLFIWDEVAFTESAVDRYAIHRRRFKMLCEGAVFEPYRYDVARNLKIYCNPVKPWYNTSGVYNSFGDTDVPVSEFGSYLMLSTDNFKFPSSEGDWVSADHIFDFANTPSIFNHGDRIGYTLNKFYCIETWALTDLEYY